MSLCRLCGACIDLHCSSHPFTGWTSLVTLSKSRFAFVPVSGSDPAPFLPHLTPSLTPFRVHQLSRRSTERISERPLRLLRTSIAALCIGTRDQRAIQVSCAGYNLARSRSRRNTESWLRIGARLPVDSRGISSCCTVRIRLIYHSSMLLVLRISCCARQPRSFERRASTL